MPQDLSTDRYEVPNTQCSVLRVTLTAEMGNRYDGVFQIIPD